MQQFTLQQLFGESVSQSATELVIKKADLVAIGLTPRINNTAESLLVALLLKWLENFSGIITAEGQCITTENGSKIDYEQDDKLYEFIQLIKWKVYIDKSHSTVIRNALIIHIFSYYEPESFE